MSTNTKLSASRKLTDKTSQIYLLYTTINPGHFSTIAVTFIPISAYVAKNCLNFVRLIKTVGSGKAGKAMALPFFTDY